MKDHNRFLGYQREHVKSKLPRDLFYWLILPKGAVPIEPLVIIGSG